MSDSIMSTSWTMLSPVLVAIPTGSLVIDCKEVIFEVVALKTASSVMISRGSLFSSLQVCYDLSL